MRDVARQIFSAYQPVVLPDGEGRIPAAVLLLFYERDGAEHILFQVRTQQVEHHKGEVSLPGGARDPEDDSLLLTALRETHEELGVHPSHIEIYGQLDDVVTRTNFTISPFVGAITQSGAYPFRSAEIEVARLMEVPIAALLGGAIIEWVDTPIGLMRCFRHDADLIFGATARVVGQFVDLLAPAIATLPGTGETGPAPSR